MAKKTVKKKAKKPASRPRKKPATTGSTATSGASKTNKKKSKRKAVAKKVAATVANSRAVKVNVSPPASRRKSKKPVKVAQPSQPEPLELESQPDAPPLSENQLRKVKSGLTRKDLSRYKQLLLEKRAELIGDVASLETDMQNASGGNLSNLPLHMADVGSDNYEQEFTLGLVASERMLLQEIDEAVIRIQKNYYGVCLETGEPIARARLDAQPWAKYCIEVAREKERLGQL